MVEHVSARHQLWILACRCVSVANGTTRFKVTTWYLEIATVLSNQSNHFIGICKSFHRKSLFFVYTMYCSPQFVLILYDLLFLGCKPRRLFIVQTIQSAFSVLSSISNREMFSRRISVWLKYALEILRRIEDLKKCFRWFLARSLAMSFFIVV